MESNNAVELVGMLQGIIIAQNQGSFPLIVEGESDLILNMASKLQNGSNSCKVSFSWRLDHDLQQLADLLSEPMEITFQNIRREANSLLDKLANKGILSPSFL